MNATRVFLVEDNPRIQADLREALTSLGDVELVGVASTSRDAQNWLTENKEHWDIAVIDVFLAEGNGFRVLRECKWRSAHQRAVVLSNYTHHPVRPAAKTMGADAVFDKSLEMDAFLEYCATRR